MREIREYNMNGTIILGVDNGYGNVKTAHRVFPTGIIKCDSEPVLSKEYIEYDGAYYIIGEGHKGFVADKQEDDDTYILTLAAIAKELYSRLTKNTEYGFRLEHRDVEKDRIFKK